MKTRLMALIEIVLVYAVMQGLGTVLRSTGIVQWELQTLGWTYTGMSLFIGIVVLLIWLTRRSWVDYGVSLADWRTNLDIGMKGYLLRLLPVGGIMLALWLGIGYTSIQGGLLIAFLDILAIIVLVGVLNRQKPVASGKPNLIVIVLLLLLPIIAAMAVNKLSLIVLSTVIWQFVFSGFGEEFIWRGYVQSQLNHSFGRPWDFRGIQFGPGLIVASLLFGLTHALNTYHPAIGLASLSWGWAIFTATGGLFLGLIREKTGTLLAPGIAHGLPDAVGEALSKVFGWM